MTLGRFSIAAGVDPKWVLNAAALLGRELDYSIAEARRLGLAKRIHNALGVPLKGAYEIAGRALALPRSNSPSLRLADGGLTFVIDFERYLSDFTIRLSRARTQYAPRRRGRRPGDRGRRAAERARDYGIDVDLVRTNLQRTPADRLRRLDRDRRLVEKLKAHASRTRPRR